MTATALALSATTLVPWAATLAVAVPLLGAVAAFLGTGRRHGGDGSARIAVWSTLFATLCGAVLVWAVATEGPQRMALAGWAPPLGIVWRIDGLAALAMTLGGAVTTLVAIHAGPALRLQGGRAMAAAFWPQVLVMLAALNALFMANDVFHLYVTLELVTLGAVAMVALAHDGHGDTMAAALRYLLVGVIGALAYLLGCGLLYAAFGTLDLDQLRAAVQPGPTAAAALALMTLGAMAKSALFPLHGWLPPAHGGAPAPASALLSGLVAKGGGYVLLRLWLEVFPGATTGPGLAATGQALGVLGALAVVWGSVQALRQGRLKLLLAYSTIAQLGYLMVALPLVAVPTPQVAGAALAGMVQLAAAHACAKAAMFLAAGCLIVSRGHDRLDELKGTARHHPMVAMTLALGGLTLIGLPPGGGFIAKWLLLEASLGSGQWWWAGVILGGSLLAGAYVFKAVAWSLTAPVPDVQPQRRVPRRMEGTALALAVTSLGLGIAAAWPLALLEGAAPW